MSNLPPLPEPTMREINPYLDLGPMDPYKGKENLEWFTPDQMTAYALQATAQLQERIKELEKRYDTLASAILSNHVAGYCLKHGIDPSWISDSELKGGATPDAGSKT